MIAAATRQDLQTALDRTKNSIIGSMFSRTDAQTIVTQIRTSILQDLHTLHTENLQVIRQGQSQRDQLMIRMANMEHNVIVLQQIMARILEQQTRAINIFGNR